MSANFALGDPILSVEDLPDSTAAVVGALRDGGRAVLEANTIESAVELVRTRPFGLILLDARVPDKNGLNVEAGVDFIVRLKAHEWGEENVDTPFLVLSSFVHEIDIELLQTLRGFIGVLNKASVTAEILQEMLGYPIAVDHESASEFIVEDLLISPEGAKGEVVSFLVPAWPENDEVAVRVDDLPDDVRIELGWGDKPFYVWARVNIAAEVAAEVRPHDFRLYVGKVEDMAAFENEDDNGIA